MPVGSKLVSAWITVPAARNQCHAEGVVGLHDGEPLRRPMLPDKPHEWCSTTTCQPFVPNH